MKIVNIFLTLTNFKKLKILLLLLYFKNIDKNLKVCALTFYIYIYIYIYIYKKI